MIRSKHNIDTKLVNFFISENNFEELINTSLIEWYGALDDKDHQNTRNKAIRFLSALSNEVLSVIDYPSDERKNLIGIFEPLERLLRTAISLKDFGPEEPEKIRDHLSHTVRIVLFANYLLSQYKLGNKSNLIKQLFVAAIFHDIAYPLEKLKKVAKKLGDATFKELLNSSGKIDIELDNPDDLLEMLNFFGELVNKLDYKRKELEATKKRIYDNETNENIKKEFIKLKNLKYKLIHIYKEIVCPAIAGQGLFDSSHSISSIVLFLRPIIKHWKDSDTYQALNFETIADICLAMAYHDRNNNPRNFNIEIPNILRIMRIADELQEWDREFDSYIKDVEIENDPSQVLSIKITMKNKDKKDICRPEMVIPHKIKGILPVVQNGSIKVKFEFPEVFEDKIKLIENLKIEGINSRKYVITGCKKSSHIELIFNNLPARIDFK
jgi:hypothetical protein